MNSNPAKIQVIDLSYPRKVHFIGIGGMGMSGLAQILLKQGHSVSGSDIDDNNINIERIKALGGRVYGNHDKGNIKKAEIVVYSSCISDNNPEIIQSKANGLEIIPRAVVLAELMKGKRSIAVSGTHGKTTVSALISLIVSRAGLEPTIIVGGELEDFNNNACPGEGNYVVAEADESDASFLYLNQTYSVITNIEPDHMDYYHNMDQVLETYEKFINNTSTNGFVVGCLDDAHILSLRQKTDKKFITYGLSAQADLRADNICLKDLGSEFDLIYHNKNLGRITIQIPGEYNILNALSACAL
ncbi:MAG: UDP-N-acetylmuramate--L-alanine ligase, partial [Candidatus Omnitrophica bacterium]|nr:UDP-N-acetylmuramate--L-alanine ligase [Candidatus Omnitrophota bacterium]